MTTQVCSVQPNMFVSIQQTLQDNFHNILRLYSQMELHPTLHSLENNKTIALKLNVNHRFYFKFYEMYTQYVNIIDKLCRRLIIIRI